VICRVVKPSGVMMRRMRVTKPSRSTNRNFMSRRPETRTYLKIARRSRSAINVG